MRWLACSFLLLLVACDGDGTGGDAGPRSDGSVMPPPAEGCAPVRLTNYELGEAGWCEVPHGLSVLPAFVRDRRMTAAIAEPYNGSSYGGDPGESCGECWEVGSPTATEIVMITDLCPNRGDGPCDGSFFHLDISREASMVLDAGFFDQGVARRVPCPVEGNVHVLVNDQNFSYMRLAFANHRVPIRGGSVQPVDASGAPLGSPVELTRSGGAWEAIDDMPLDRGGEGVVFTLVAATGQTVTSDIVVPTRPDPGSVFDLGVQLDGEAEGGMCELVPDGTVYDDAWGGIDGVEWAINPWGQAEEGFFGEVTDGCFMDSASCVRVETLAPGTGFHVFNRMYYPISTYRTLTMQLSASAATTLNIMPSDDGMRCEMTPVMVGPGFSEVTIDVPAVCTGFEFHNGFTVENIGDLVALTLDDIRFVP